MNMKKVVVYKKDGTVTSLIAYADTEREALQSLVTNWYDMFANKETIGIESITIEKDDEPNE